MPPILLQYPLQVPLQSCLQPLVQLLEQFPVQPEHVPEQLSEQVPRHISPQSFLHDWRFIGNAAIKVKPRIGKVLFATFLKKSRLFWSSLSFFMICMNYNVRILKFFHIRFDKFLCIWHGKYLGNYLNNYHDNSPCIGRSKRPCMKSRSPFCTIEL